MKVSFIIPSVDRTNQLLSCINSIEIAKDRQKDVEVEIIVVYNGEGYNNQPLKIKKPATVKYFNIKVKGPSKARNYGITKSSGDYLMFLDDDASVSEDFLEKLFINMRNDVNIYFARLLNPSDKLPFTGIYCDTKMKYLNFFDYSYAGGTTMTIKRETLFKIGQFDDRFGSADKYRGAEEGDLFFRLLQNREKILYLPDLIIFHAIVKETSPGKVFDYAYSVGALLMKQILADWRRFYVYSFIFFMIVFKSLLRSAQVYIFPNSVKGENRRYQYFSVFQGTVSGFMSYYRNE